VIGRKGVSTSEGTPAAVALQVGRNIVTAAIHAAESVAGRRRSALLGRGTVRRCVVVGVDLAFAPEGGGVQRHVLGPHPLGEAVVVPERLVPAGERRLL